MTYITQLIGRKAIFSSRLLTMLLIGFVLVVLQSSTVNAQWATNGNNINNTNTGNVGIGTANPAWGRLQVNKSIRIDDDSGSSTGSDTLLASPNLYLGTSTGGNAFQFNSNGGLDLWQYNGTAWGRTVTFAKTGNVGIGTTNPGRPLVVTADAGGIPLRVYRNASTVGWGTGIQWAFNNSSGNVTDYAYVNSSIVTNTAGAENGTLGFFTVKAGTLTQQAIIDQNGNVGIGNTVPTAKLDITGNLNASGTITGGNIVAKYQDVAEWVESSQRLAAGTVVVLDQTKSNQVIASSQAYDTRVAGVISAQPGITLGANGTGKVLVATTGRVRIKVDASRRSIQVGDLLVTSDVAGAAMKSQPINVGGIQIHRPGTLIGKALEPLEKGTGEILVLLSLQ